MFLCKSKCRYSNNCLQYFERSFAKTVNGRAFPDWIQSITQRQQRGVPRTYRHLWLIILAGCSEQTFSKTALNQVLIKTA